MASPRVPLFDRLPELYRIRDAEQVPADQLRHFLALVEDAFGEIHFNIESLYHDLFIEHCADWVIPYIGDLVGTSTLKGDPWTLRADVADTIALRRRKGTRAAIELLTHDLSGWGVHAVELFKRLVWAQHLNHQRPDAGGEPPYAGSQPPPVVKKPALNLRGGTVELRDPAALSLIDTPFDWTAHLPDLTPPELGGRITYNLPDLAIFLWRLAAYQVEITHPTPGVVQPIASPAPTEAAFAVRFKVHPLGKRLRLFNSFFYDPDAEPPTVTHLDGQPGPIEPARLTSADPQGHPERYVDIQLYDPSNAESPLIPEDHGLRLHFPQAAFPLFANETWIFRGANLCAWETPLAPFLRNREVVIDPAIGRLVVGVATQAEANALAADMQLTYNYGAVGPVGAHPIPRPGPALGCPPDPSVVVDEVVIVPRDMTLDAALARAAVASTAKLVIEIDDSQIHALTAAQAQVGLARSVSVRAGDLQRPIVRIDDSLAFAPASGTGAFDVQLDGLYVTPSAAFPVGHALIARAAVNQLELDGVTLDPGGDLLVSMTPDQRAPAIVAMTLDADYGFAAQPDADAFSHGIKPAVRIIRSVTGSLFIEEQDENYSLYINDSIIDAAGGAFAISGTVANPSTTWASATRIDGVTVFGRARLDEGSGSGGIFTARLEVNDHQTGCFKYCSFSGDQDRLPQLHACVSGRFVAFTSDEFGEPGYGQLAITTDFDVRERGPDDDYMGAFGFLLEAHKWKNLRIRFREFMPVGVKPLLIPVT